MKKALIFGGNGFLGAYIVRELCLNNYQVVIFSRTEGNVKTLKTYGFPGQVVWKEYNANSAILNVDTNFEVYDVVINLIGIARNTRKNSFFKVHSDFPSQVATATRKAGVKFIHVAALTPKIHSSDYAKTKQSGEVAVLKNNPKAIVINPSLIIGEGGSFIQTFEKIISLSPIVPLVFGGKTKINPVFAGDIAKFIFLAIERPDLEGKSFNLLGDEIILMGQFIEKIAGFMNKRRIYIGMPMFFFKIIFTIKQFLPNFVFRTTLTKEILELAKYDLTKERNDIKLLISNPQALDETLGLVLQKYKLYD